MMAGGLVAWFLAVDAEGKSLEDIATPLAAAGARRRTGSVRAEGATRPYSPESWRIAGEVGLPGIRLCWAINAVEAIADEPLTAKEGWRRFVDRQPHPPVLLGAAWLANCLSVT